MSIKTPFLASILAVLAGATAALEAAAIEGLVYVASPPCTLVRTAGSPAGRLAAGETRAFRARGPLDLRAQGGPAGGCGIPAEARVVAVTLRLADPTGAGVLKAWPAGAPQPRGAIREYGGELPALSAPALLELCSGACAADFQAATAGAGVHLRADLLGYFTVGAAGPPGPTGAPGPTGPPGLPGERRR
jgi:hypothetical protein